MTSTLLFFIIAVSIVGSITLDSFVFHVVYLISGALLIGKWWGNHSLSSLRFSRRVNSHAFLGEEISARLVILNPSYIPVPWVEVKESLPLELSNTKLIQKIFSLPPKGSVSIDYSLFPRKRGYYALGPSQFSTGDLLGLSAEMERLGPSSYLTVYPKIIPIANVKVPSRSPMGILRHHQATFEDPSRHMGKRDYLAGDSLRKIDWKSSAAINRLQVKLFEPSKNIESVLALNLNQDDYFHKSLYDASELAISLAASLAHWITEQRQSVGFITNGVDPLSSSPKIEPIKAKKGRANLMHILELLARIQIGKELHFTNLIHQFVSHLPWGTSLIVITGHCDNGLINELHQSQKKGISILLFLVGQIQGLKDLERRAKVLNIPIHHFQDEKDLESISR